MSWGLAWKRASEIFHLSLSYGKDDLEPISDNPSRSSSASPTSSASGSPPSNVNSVLQDHLMGFRIELDWTTGDDEDQMALRLQSQIMVALPLPQDAVAVELAVVKDDSVDVDMKVVKRREPLRAVLLTKSVVSGQQNDGTGVLIRLIRSNLVTRKPGSGDGAFTCGEHWRSITLLSLAGCGLTVMPAELIRLPLLEKLYLDNNKLTVLPPELGGLKTLKVLSVDCNMLVSVPVELRQCIGLVELSLENNKLVRPLLDLRAMSELKILRLFGNPLEFLPEILPLHKLRHLSLANTRIVADEYLRSVSVQIEMENSSYFVASRHKLSAFFALIFRFSSCHHPLLASALAKIMQDQENRIVVGKDENAVRQLISMISSDNRHVVEQACAALSSLAADTLVAMQLMKCDIMQPIETVLRSLVPAAVISVLQVLASLAFASDTVSQKMLTRDVIKSLKLLCANKNPEVQRLALLAVGNLSFCLENRRILVTSESLRELLMQMTFAPVPRVHKAAARALAILGENETLRRAIKARPVPKQGLRILAMDGGGMKGLATVQILKEIEKGTGKRIHELFDLICGTSTGGMLAVALGIKLMSLDQCEEIYKSLGKLVFAEPVPKENEAATWREKLDLLYKSSSQSYRVVVHGSKHSADQFERLLKEMCADEDGDLLIESAAKNVPKVFVVSTLVSVMPAQPFLFRNYQYPAGTPEITLPVSESSAVTGIASTTGGRQVCYKHSAFIGSSRHQVWEAIRASSAAPYYLDDFSDDVNRWQDGAIVANNPTIFAIREAQHLWPDTKIDCLVSIGCGSVPTKARKGGWRYLDTGQVLIESACSVDRAEEALSTLLPMLPAIHYFRFNPVDERCDMELDETDPAVWLKLEAAFEEYIQINTEVFKNVCQRLQLPYQIDDNLEVNLRSHNLSNCEASSPGGSGPSLGWRHNVLLVEALQSPDSVKLGRHARALETFCAHNGIRLSLMQGISGGLSTTPCATFPTPFASPLLTGSFPTNPLPFSPPDVGSQKAGRIDVVPPLSLDESQSGKRALSPSKTSESRQLSPLVQSLNEKLHDSQQVGIVHLILQNDSIGSILCWKNDVFVVAEPGEHADKFLQSVKCSLLSVLYNQRRRGTALLAKISSIADLVAFKPCFEIEGIVHRYMGRQTQVMGDDKEIGAYMFRRTVPSARLTPDDVRWMPGAWKDRIIICTGTYGPTPALIKAFLDSGAKAVICPSAQPQEMQMISSPGSAELNNSESSKYEIGVEEAEDEKREEFSLVSDWEESNGERSRNNVAVSKDDEDEKELSQFVCRLYELLFREGAGVDAALQKAVGPNGKLSHHSHLIDRHKMAAPPAIGARGTIGSFLRKEIEYLSKFESEKGGSLRIVHVPRHGFSFLTMRWKRKEQRGGSTSCGFLSSFCSMVKVTETSRLKRTIPGYNYRILTHTNGA